MLHCTIDALSSLFVNIMSTSLQHSTVAKWGKLACLAPRFGLLTDLTWHERPHSTLPPLRPNHASLHFRNTITVRPRRPGPPTAFRRRTVVVPASASATAAPAAFAPSPSAGERPWGEKHPACLERDIRPTRALCKVRLCGVSVPLSESAGQYACAIGLCLLSSPLWHVWKKQNSEGVVSPSPLLSVPLFRRVTVLECTHADAWVHRAR
jgi:hypothetical protein